MRVTIAGSSGLIGSSLLPALAGRGHEVVRLVRREPAEADELQWDPAEGVLPATALDGVDAVVNLAGATIGQRWSERARERILSSRVDTTRLLAEAVAARAPHTAFVAASAVGYYGDRGDEELTEASVKGAGFLADVSDAWESAARAAHDAGARTVHLRQGIVLSAEGGALARLLTPFRLGVGGRVGSGAQYWSWISLRDIVAAYVWAIEGDASGAVNAMSPRPVTNAEFTKALGTALRRPTRLPLPAIAVRTMFGAMGEEMLLGGQRALPTRLVGAGFAFAHPEVEAGIRSALR
jgi:uncharacterized protein (TIGR01777 family)